MRTALLIPAMEQAENQSPRRIGTRSILFADLKGFGSLTNDGIRKFFRIAWQKVADLCQSFEASHVNTWGDGLFCTFEHPNNAASMALELQTYFTNTEWRLLFDLPNLEIRCGLHFADIEEVWDPIRRGHTAMGTAIAFAARIEPVTSPGSIFVTEEFYHAISSRDFDKFVFDKLPGLYLPKLTGLHELYRLRRPNWSPHIPISSLVVGSPFKIPAFDMIAETTLTLAHLLKREIPKYEIFLAAQNHFFITCAANRDAFKEALFIFCHQNPQRRVKILLNDVRDAAAVGVWTHVTAPQFPQHLTEATEALSQWQRDARRVGLEKQFHVRVTEFVPMSMTFVDPETEDGFVVVVPNSYIKESKVRPTFVLIKKDHPGLFASYWEPYSDRFDARSSPIPI